MKKQSLHGTPGAGTRDMVQVALFAALIVALAFLPFIGYIPLGFTKATTIHIPVIIGSILLGPQKGAVLGGVFGLTSLINNTLYPTATSFVFSPFYSAGAFKGGWASLIICFVPRILVGVTPWLVYTLIKFLFRKSNAGVQTVGMVIAGIVGALTNTALVMGSIGVIFTEAYAAAQGIPADAVMGFILGIVAANGIPEAIVAAVITPAVCVPMVRALKLEKAPAAAQPA